MLSSARVRMPCCDSKYGFENDTTLARSGVIETCAERDVVVGGRAGDDGVEAHVADVELREAEHLLHALGDVVLVARGELGRVGVAALPESGPGQAGHDRQRVGRSGLKSAAAAGLGVSPQGPSAPAAVVVVLPPLSGLLLLPHAVDTDGDGNGYSDDCEPAHAVNLRRGSRER